MPSNEGGNSPCLKESLANSIYLTQEDEPTTPVASQEIRSVVPLHLKSAPESKSSLTSVSERLPVNQTTGQTESQYLLEQQIALISKYSGH